MKKIFFLAMLCVSILTCCKKVSITEMAKPAPAEKPYIEFVTPVEGKHFLPGDTMHLSWKSVGFGTQTISVMSGHVTPSPVVAWGFGNDLPNNGSMDIVIPTDSLMKGEWSIYTLAGTFPMAYRRFFID